MAKKQWFRQENHKRKRQSQSGVYGSPLHTSKGHEALLFTVNGYKNRKFAIRQVRSALIGIFATASPPDNLKNSKKPDATSVSDHESTTSKRAKFDISSDLKNELSTLKQMWKDGNAGDDDNDLFIKVGNEIIPFVYKDWFTLIDSGKESFMILIHPPKHYELNVISMCKKLYEHAHPNNKGKVNEKSESNIFSLSNCVRVIPFQSITSVTENVVTDAIQKYLTLLESKEKERESENNNLNPNNNFNQNSKEDDKDDNQNSKEDDKDELLVTGTDSGEENVTRVQNETSCSIDTHLKSGQSHRENRIFTIVLKKRDHMKHSKDTLKKWCCAGVKASGIECKQKFKLSYREDPDIVVYINVIRSICCLSIIPGSVFKNLTQFNISKYTQIKNKKT